jgi:hypothetical protein
VLFLGTSWRRVTSFTPRPLYSRGKILRSTMNRVQIEPRFGRRGKKEYGTPTGTRTLTSLPPSPVPSSNPDCSIPPRILLQQLQNRSMEVSYYSTTSVNDICVCLCLSDNPVTGSCAYNNFHFLILSFSLLDLMQKMKLAM